MYKIALIFALICLLLSVILRPKKMKIREIVRFNDKDSILLARVDKIICKNKYFYRLKEKFISELRIINYKSYEYNNELILKYLVIDTVISLFVFIILSMVIAMWYAVITISFVVFYITIFFGTSIIKNKIMKIHRHFPMALQCFLDEYIIHKTIKDAINCSYSKMPSDIGGAFELLARELSGEKNYKISIKKFANGLSYVWGYSFAELLIMSYEGTGDITDELLVLNSMVSEEITADEEEKSSSYANKMTFVFIYVAALIGLIVNLFTNNLASYLYFYTSNGNALIATWLSVLIIGVTVISMSEKGS